MRTLEGKTMEPRRLTKGPVNPVRPNIPLRSFSEAYIWTGLPMFEHRKLLSLLTSYVDNQIWGGNIESRFFYFEYK